MHAVADLHKTIDAPGPIFFIFMQCSRKFGQILGWRPNPTSGKSWIRRKYGSHCTSYRNMTRGKSAWGYTSPLWTESQTDVKHYLSATLFADGNELNEMEASSVCFRDFRMNLIKDFTNTLYSRCNCRLLTIIFFKKWITVIPDRSTVKSICLIAESSVSKWSPNWLITMPSPGPGVDFLRCWLFSRFKCTCQIR